MNAWTLHTPCDEYDVHATTAWPMRKRHIALLGLATALLATVGTSARIEAGAVADPATAKPAQIVAIISTNPARLTVLDARTLRRAPASWSLKLAAWSGVRPTVLSPAGSRVAVVRGETEPALIVDTTTGRVLRRVRGDAETLYWLRGEGTGKASPALVVDATLACFSGGVPGGVCGDDVNVLWTSGRRVGRGSSVVYDGLFVDGALRAGLVLASSEAPRALVLWQPTAQPAVESAFHPLALSKMPEKSPYAIAVDVLDDRVFVVTSTGLVATIRRASTRKPLVQYHSVTLNGGSFTAAWAGSGRIALWGQDGLGTIDTRTWTTHAVADGVTGALPTRFGIAAWTSGPDGLSVYRPNGTRRFNVLEGTRVTAARAIGTYVYVDTDVDTRYSIDLRTGRTTGPLVTSAQIIGPSFVTIP